MLSIFSKTVILLVVVFVGMTGCLFGQSDLARLIDLIDQEKYSSLSEIKQLREKNSQNRQQSALFDIGYALSAIKFGRSQEALENYSAYEPLDVASNKEFLQEIAKKFDISH